MLLDKLMARAFVKCLFEANFVSYLTYIKMYLLIIALLNFDFC